MYDNTANWAGDDSAPAAAAAAAGPSRHLRPFPPRIPDEDEDEFDSFNADDSFFRQIDAVETRAPRPPPSKPTPAPRTVDLRSDEDPEEDDDDFEIDESFIRAVGDIEDRATARSRPSSAKRRRKVVESDSDEGTMDSAKENQPEIIELLSD